MSIPREGLHVVQTVSSISFSKNGGGGVQETSSAPGAGSAIPPKMYSLMWVQQEGTHTQDKQPWGWSESREVPLVGMQLSPRRGWGHGRHPGVSAPDGSGLWLRPMSRGNIYPWRVTQCEQPALLSRG